MFTSSSSSSKCLDNLEQSTCHFYKPYKIQTLKNNSHFIFPGYEICAGSDAVPVRLPRQWLLEMPLR